MSNGKNIEIKIAATGGDQAEAEASETEKRKATLAAQRAAIDAELASLA